MILACDPSSHGVSCLSRLLAVYHRLLLCYCRKQYIEVRNGRAVDSLEASFRGTGYIEPGEKWRVSWSRHTVTSRGRLESTHRNRVGDTARFVGDVTYG